MMVGTLAFVLGLGVAASQAEAGSLENAEVRQCREWIQSHSPRPPERSALTRIVSPRTLCFDGDIYAWTASEALAWADRVEAERGARPRLVVRSPGGDASVAIAIAEKLQRRDAEVTVVDYCISSCANYFFAGLRRRHVAPGALILFHGGYSRAERGEFAASVDRASRDPKMAAHMKDPGKWRNEQMQKYDRDLIRQNALYRRAGVDPLIVTGIKAVDEKALPAADCGRREGAPRSSLFFDSRQLRRLGIVIRQGRPATDPADVDQRLSRFGFAGTACAAPSAVFGARSLKERLPR